MTKPMRKLPEVIKANDELFDKRWYGVHVEIGSPEAGEKNAKRIEKKYGKETLETEIREGLLDGKHSAIRWILGGEWDELDT